MIDSFTVFITLTVPPAVENILGDVTIALGIAFERINLSETFSDPAGEILTYRAVSSDTTVVSVALSGDTLTLTEIGKGTSTITVTATNTLGLYIDALFEVTIYEYGPNSNDLLGRCIHRIGSRV